MSDPVEVGGGLFFKSVVVLVGNGVVEYAVAVGGKRW